MYGEIWAQTKYLLYSCSHTALIHGQTIEYSLKSAVCINAPSVLVLALGGSAITFH